MGNFNEVRSYVDILGVLAKGYVAGSSEETALRMAALALLYLLDSDQIEAYRAFVAAANQALNAEQKEFLRKMGLSEDNRKGREGPVENLNP